jgi:membrane protein involved in colicin uptake
MSKKPKQSRHRVPSSVLDAALKADEIDDRYQVEIDSSIAKLQRQYVKAQKAHAAAVARQERIRLQAEALAEKKAAQERIASHRADEEAKLTDRMAVIKEAAKNSRIAAIRAGQERQYAEFIARRNAQTEQRKAALKAARDHERQLIAARNALRTAEATTAERHRELKEIELLMMPGNYAGRSHRDTSARHWAGA